MNLPEDLIYYKSPSGIYIASSASTNYSGRSVLRGTYLFNGKTPVSTHHDAWLFIPDETELKKLEQLKSGGKINFRWALSNKDDELVKKLNLPEEISLEDAHEYDDDYSKYIGKECEQYSVRHFYDRVHDMADDYYEQIDFEIKFLGDIQSEWTNNLVTDTYKVYKTEYKSEGFKELDLGEVARYSELEQMMTPDLLIHNRPCKLTSKQTYDIVRYWILDNIDSAYAAVTSDYDFCFTVKKKISIKPYVVKNEQLTQAGKSYRKPRFTTKSVKHTVVEIFEMTNNVRKYKGYTVIEGFEGDSLQDLANNIKAYLSELMDYINKPVSQCSHCDGTGHIVGNDFELNKR